MYYSESKRDLFPIITPAFPSMNSTYNVSLTTRNVMITELEKGMKITEHIMKKNPNVKISWKRLFKKFPFFSAYSHFIQIQILSLNQDIHEKWKGYVESKIRGLLLNLEKFNNALDCLEFRPWPRGYVLELGKDSSFQVNHAYYF